MEGWSKKRKIKAFAEKHGELSPVESQIVEIYRERWDSTLGRLLRKCADRENVIDLRVDFREEIDRLSNRIKKFPFPFSFLFSWSAAIQRLLNPRSLPEEIFSCKDTKVILNPDNRKFLLNFFTEVGILDGEKDYDGDNECSEPREGSADTMHSTKGEQG